MSALVVPWRPISNRPDERADWKSAATKSWHRRRFEDRLDRLRLAEARQRPAEQGGGLLALAGEPQLITAQEQQHRVARVPPQRLFELLLMLVVLAVVAGVQLLGAELRRRPVGVLRQPR